MEFIGYLPGLGYEAEEDCIALKGRWMNVSEFRNCLKIPGFFPTGLVVKKDRARYVVVRGELVPDAGSHD